MIKSFSSPYCICLWSTKNNAGPPKVGTLVDRMSTNVPSAISKTAPIMMHKMAVNISAPGAFDRDRTVFSKKSQFPSLKLNEKLIHVHICTFLPEYQLPISILVKEIVTHSVFSSVSYLLLRCHHVWSSPSEPDHPQREHSPACGAWQLWRQHTGPQATTSRSVMSRQ